MRLKRLGSDSDCIAPDLSPPGDAESNFCVPDINRQARESYRVKPNVIDGDLIALTKWAQQVGVTAVTVWRWRKAGWITPVNICGRLYLSRTEINSFVERASRGEFSQLHPVPQRAVAPLPS